MAVKKNNNNEKANKDNKTIMESLAELDGHAFTVTDLGNKEADLGPKIGNYMSTIGKRIVNEYNSNLGKINDKLLEIKDNNWAKIIQTEYSDGVIGVYATMGYDSSVFGPNPDANFMFIGFTAESHDPLKFRNEKIVNITYQIVEKGPSEEKEELLPKGCVIS